MQRHLARPQRLEAEAPRRRGHGCIASTAVMVAGPDTREEFWRCASASSENFQSESSRSVSENKGEIRWHQEKKETRNTGKGISRRTPPRAHRGRLGRLRASSSSSRRRPFPAPVTRWPPSAGGCLGWL